MLQNSPLDCFSQITDLEQRSLALCAIHSPEQKTKSTQKPCKFDVCKAFICLWRQKQAPVLQRFLKHIRFCFYRVRLWVIDRTLNNNLSYFSACRHTVNKQHFNIIIAYITCKQHTVAHFTAEFGGLEICYNYNAFAD